MMSKYHLAVAVAVWASACAARENRGTPEQRAACAPDAFRLCSAYIPDPARVELCLRHNRPELSDACRSVFAHSEGLAAGARKQSGQED